MEVFDAHAIHSSGFQYSSSPATVFSTHTGSDKVMQLHRVRDGSGLRSFGSKQSRLLRWMLNCSRAWAFGFHQCTLMWNWSPSIVDDFLCFASPAWLAQPLKPNTGCRVSYYGGGARFCVSQPILLSVITWVLHFSCLPFTHCCSLFFIAGGRSHHRRPRTSQPEARQCQPGAPGGERIPRFRHAPGGHRWSPLPELLLTGAPEPSLSLWRQGPRRPHGRRPRCCRGRR